LKIQHNFKDMQDLENELSELETLIASLLSKHQELGDENEMLRQKLAKLLQEKAVWQNKKEKTTAKIKQIINNMKRELP
jgi:hypothetical protein